MLELALIWTAIGLLVGAFGLFGWARPAEVGPRGIWSMLARMGLGVLGCALVTVVCAWMTSALVGRVAATAVSPGAAAIAALVVAIAPGLWKRVKTNSATGIPLAR